jgi:hypothetical protein
MFRKQQITINLQVKDAFCTCDEGEGFNYVLVVREDIIRRTDGSFGIVSRNAIFKCYDIFLFHKSCLSPFNLHIVGCLSLLHIGQINNADEILTSILPWANISFASGPVAQLGERYNRTVEVRSSNLLRSMLRLDIWSGTKIE